MVHEGANDIRYFTIADAKGRYRTNYELQLGNRVEGGDGSHRWIQDVNGNVTIEPITRHRPLAIRLLGYNVALLEEERLWTPDGTTQLDGRRVYRLRTKLQQADAVFYVDAETALLSGVDAGDRSVRYPDS